MRARKPMFYSGLGCIAFGIAVMWYFQHSGRPNFGLSVFQCMDRHTTGYATDYAQERVLENWHKLFVVMDSRAVPGVIVIIAAAALRIMRARMALGLTFLALLGATVVFGIVDEMRVYLPFISLLIVATK